MKTVGLLVLVALLLLLAGCAGYGPMTVSRDRFDYTAAISDSWKRQMLFNLVKIRYGDAPVFLDVSSVISQYQIAGQINMAATINNDPFSTSQTFAAMGQYVDRPTITYTPILGDKFARSMMAPVPPSAILSLIQGGYPADLVFRTLVHEINGVRNRFGGEGRAHSADPEFYAFIDNMRKIQMAGGVGMRFTKLDNQEAAMMVFRGKRDPETEDLAMEARKIIGLDPVGRDFRVIYGAIPRDDKEITILTRSVLEVLVDLSTDIQVPAADVAGNRVSPTFAEMAGGKEVRPLVRIQSSSAKPADAFVWVPYRNSYFWVDDRDFMSKKIFSFLMFIFTLVETGDKGTVPIVTVPTG
jgi:hypothetical protein